MSKEMDGLKDQINKLMKVVGPMSEQIESLTKGLQASQKQNKEHQATIAQQSAVLASVETLTAETGKKRRKLVPAKRSRFTLGDVEYQFKQGFVKGNQVIHPKKWSDRRTIDAALEDPEFLKALVASEAAKKFKGGYLTTVN